MKDKEICAEGHLRRALATEANCLTGGAWLRSGTEEESATQGSLS